MKVLKMLSSALLVTIFCLLALPLMAAEPAHLIPAGVSSLTIFITIGLICLVVGLGLRGFSKPPADLSINQPKK
jgi:uncharacterized membrane protein YcfT